MHAVAETRVRSTTTLSTEQRERLRREGRIARAVEAAQRRTWRRFSRSVFDANAPRDSGGRPPPP
jgi:hypothetical protein